MGGPERWNPPREWDRNDKVMQIFMWGIVIGTIAFTVGLFVGLQF